ncbi:hypothetical protein BpHYR1_052050 [Brachionus plicatilis]|uniref:Uncharacterized protein n=1 Tax=Brachionus plicatilis TaxID=10195 RepID=A0A3M7RHU4_BRAPC|nr:hypothetical protein BpHYR1_052050 [Brachionus plicatilis]
MTSSWTWDDLFHLVVLSGPSVLSLLIKIKDKATSVDKTNLELAKKPAQSLTLRQTNVSDRISDDPTFKLVDLSYLSAQVLSPNFCYQ